MSANYPPPDRFRQNRLSPARQIQSQNHIQNPFLDTAAAASDAPPTPPQHGVPRALTPGLASPSPGPTPLRSPESSDFLLPPRPPRSRSRPRHEPPVSPEMSMFSSRRTSFDSAADTDAASTSADTPRQGYYAVNPFADSRTPSRGFSDNANTADNGSDVNTQTVATKYNIMPSDGLLLFPEDVEKDDYLHNPRADDLERDCDVCNRRGMVNVAGLGLLVAGILMLFVGYPVLTVVKRITQPAPSPCANDPLCLDVGERSLLKNIRTGLIDPDTPDSAMRRKSVDGKEWKLVFSDEFNTEGRSFYDGDDAYYQAVDLWYGVTQDLEWYDPDAVTTKDGVLEIRFDEFRNHDLDYRSGMVQSWNKLCFTGGRLEASVSMPGAGDVSGFWPGFWSMGNLGRPGFAATTDGMWPYSYHDECDVGITPNQSTPDGRNFLPGMKLPACTCDDATHPTPGKSRSAPELDVFEANVHPLNGNPDAVIGVASQSMQVAPFDIWYMPDYDFTAVYDARITEINPYRGGVYQQAMSAVSNLNNDWYNGTAYQVYAFEYTPGASGDVTWFVGADTPTWTLDGRAMGPNGNIGQRVVPVEPMSVIMNLGMASNFAPINDTIETYMPAFLRFDYIRIYQDPDAESVSCDPPGYETTGYIDAFPTAYQNVNKTRWTDAGYEWPKNSLMDGC